MQFSRTQILCQTCDHSMQHQLSAQTPQPLVAFIYGWMNQRPASSGVELMCTIIEPLYRNAVFEYNHVIYRQTLPDARRWGIVSYSNVCWKKCGRVSECECCCCSACVCTQRAATFTILFTMHTSFHNNATKRVSFGPVDYPRREPGVDQSGDLNVLTLPVAYFINVG